jgi:hypothetical protein
VAMEDEEVDMDTEKEALLMTKKPSMKKVN